MGITLSQLSDEDVKSFSRLVENKDFEYIREYISDNLDRLRVESDRILDRDFDLISKGARQILSELVNITDIVYLKRIQDKRVQNSERSALS